MSVWKRAGFCVIRKWVGSTLMFAVILIVMLAVSTVAAVGNAVEEARTGQGEFNMESNIEVFDDADLQAWEDAAKEEATRDMVQKMEKLLRVLTGGIFLTGLAILAFVMAFRVQNRIREYGILIANGISKCEIVVQNLLETGMISAAGFIAASILARPVTGLLVPMITGGAVQKGMILAQNYLLLYSLSAGIIILASLVSSLQILLASPRTLLSKLS